MYLHLSCLFLFFKQKTAYDVRISDLSSDVCSSDLRAMLDEGEGPVRRQVGRLEEIPDLLRCDLLAAAVGLLLHLLAEGDLQLARQVEAVLAAQDVGDAALAGLAVDAHHRLGGAPAVLRVDRQIGPLPESGIDLLHRRPALLYGVLVRSGEN